MTREERRYWRNQYIKLAAIAALGYPVSCPSPHRVQIPRIPFLRFWEGG